MLSFGTPWAFALLSTTNSGMFLSGSAEPPAINVLERAVRCCEGKRGTSSCDYNVLFIPLVITSEGARRNPTYAGCFCEGNTCGRVQYELENKHASSYTQRTSLSIISSLFLFYFWPLEIPSNSKRRVESRDCGTYFVVSRESCMRDGKRSTSAKTRQEHSLAEATLFNTRINISRSQSAMRTESKSW